MAYVIQKDQAGTLLHIVRSVIGTGTVTGQAANLTYVLRDESGNTQTSGLTITEQGATGYYDISVTPDAVGNWLLSVTNPAGTDEATYDYPVQCVLSAAGHSPSGTFLATLANMKERLGISGTNTNYPDAYLNNIIARASQAIERIVGRPLVQASYTEYVDGDGSRYLNLRRGPIQSITSVSSVTYDSSGTETATALTENVDYIIRGDESDWYLHGWLESVAGSFWSGQRNYKVVYTAGFSSVPYDLESACLDLCVAQINRRKDEGTSSRDVSGGSMSFTAPTDTAKYLREMLAPYIDMRVF